MHILYNFNITLTHWKRVRRNTLRRSIVVQQKSDVMHGCANFGAAKECSSTLQSYPEGLLVVALRVYFECCCFVVSLVILIANCYEPRCIDSTQTHAKSEMFDVSMSGIPECWTSSKWSRGATRDVLLVCACVYACTCVSRIIRAAKSSLVPIFRLTAVS